MKRSARLLMLFKATRKLIIYLLVITLQFSCAEEPGQEKWEYYSNNGFFKISNMSQEQAAEILKIVKSVATWADPPTKPIDQFGDFGPMTEVLRSNRDGSVVIRGILSTTGRSLEIEGRKAIRFEEKDVHLMNEVIFQYAVKNKLEIIKETGEDPSGLSKFEDPYEKYKKKP